MVVKRRWLPQPKTLVAFHNKKIYSNSHLLCNQIKEEMCRRVTCDKCKKFTWAGCGQHIESALAGLKPEEICQCPRTCKSSFSCFGLLLYMIFVMISMQSSC